MVIDTSPAQSAARAEHAAMLAALVPSAASCTLSIEGNGLQIRRRGRLSGASPAQLSIILGGTAADIDHATAWGADGTTATVCVRADEQDHVFFSRVKGVRGMPAEPAGIAEVEVTLAPPEQVISTRRRCTFRIAVSDADGISLRLWRIDQYAILRDQPPPSRLMKSQLCDLGAAGMRAILWAGKVQALQLVEDQRFRAELKGGDVEMILDARLRHPRATRRDDEFAFCGFEFAFDDDDIESRRNRQKLDGILAKLQRSAARRDAA